VVLVVGNKAVECVSHRVRDSQQKNVRFAANLARENKCKTDPLRNSTSGSGVMTTGLLSIRLLALQKSLDARKGRGERGGMRKKVGCRMSA